MDDRRTVALIGSTAADKLRRARVMVVGLGGVGGYCVEALVRAGVGALVLVDGDTVDASNLNRQILATEKTVGRPKAAVCEERVRAINPDCGVSAMEIFVDKSTVDALPIASCDYIVDCIDTVTSKVLLAESAQRCNVPILSSMGSGNKLHADFIASDLYRTTECPLARAMRGLCKKAGIERLDVLYSADPPTVKCRPPASISYAPAMLGLKCAEFVLNKIMEKEEC